MSTSMPLPNVLMPAKPALQPPPGASVPAKQSPAGADSALSFKQSFQNVEPSPKAPAAATAQARPSADSDLASEDTAAESPLVFVQLMGLRQNAAASEAPSALGVAYLTRFAAAMETSGELQQQGGSAHNVELPAAFLDPETVELAAVGVGLIASDAAAPPLSAALTQAASPLNELNLRFNASGADSAASGKLLPPALNLHADLQATTSTNPAVASNPSALLESSSLLASPLQALHKGLPVDFKSLVTESTLAGTAILADTEAASELESHSPLTAAGLQKPGGLALQLEGRTALPMNVAFGTAQWSNALAERTAWMAGQAIHSAEIQLDPPELGPLQIKIQVNQDQASVNFVSANPLVREAVEQTMSRLRELFQSQGMELVDSGVADQQSGKQREQAESGNLSGSLSSSDDEGTTLDGELHNVVTAVPWGVDYYA